ncbi:MAG: RdgB/HAM1 family non-canonical purine NTP pyrophosphatase [Gammaproteobacteria bacterium]|nr:RdgB/HAM1 family non-canonical purine NTP pyrophosphatase [Gammaproteobacteria bacterium]
MTKLVLASTNQHKLIELNAMFSQYENDANATHHHQIFSQSEYSIPPIAETGTTFIENAIIKARHSAHHTKLPTIADDSGLTIAALNNQPGVYSSRFAGNSATDRDNLEKVLDLMQKIPNEKRQATFHCVLVLMLNENDPTPLIAHGFWHGYILTKPQGKNGFGYDPIFFVPTHNCSAAELPTNLKNQISHRGQALQKLRDML